MRTAGSLHEALGPVLAGTLRPDVIVADYHLDDGHGLDAITPCGRPGGGRAGGAAHRRPLASVRERAAEQRVQVLNKPLKPAALRALLTQWRRSARRRSEGCRLPMCA